MALSAAERTARWRAAHLEQARASNRASARRRRREQPEKIAVASAAAYRRKQAAMTVDGRKVQKEFRRVRSARYRALKPQKMNAYNRQYRKAVADEVFKQYGGACVCCGESERAFLTIDHIYNDGAAERCAAGGPTNTFPLMLRLRKAGYPRDRYRILCFNCNCGRQRVGGGACPHETMSTPVSDYIAAHRPAVAMGG